MKKPPDPTPPSFPILGDNFCKVYVYIIDLLDLDRIQNFLSTRNPFIFHKNFTRTVGEWAVPLLSLLKIAPTLLYLDQYL